MVKKLNLNISINKRTGQLTTSLPKKKLSKKKLKEILKTKKIRIELK